MSALPTNSIGTCSRCGYYGPGPAHPCSADTAPTDSPPALPIEGTAAPVETLEAATVDPVEVARLACRSAEAAVRVLSRQIADASQRSAEAYVAWKAAEKAAGGGK